MGKKRNIYRILVRKHEGKSRFEDLYFVDGRIILKCTLKPTGWVSMDFIHMAHDMDK
jgi:hypothetical protein